MSVNVQVEYCGTCGYSVKFDELSKNILESHPDVKITGYEGRRASFEVKINGTLIHSKLSTMAFPDYQDVSDIISEVSTAGSTARISKQQPITSCTLM